MAARFPNSQITAVSNSQSQRSFIEQRCREQGLRNLRVITSDIGVFDAGRKFDRVVSVEMFEHVRNHHELLRRISTWLTPEGQLFVHIFCHKESTYLFETEGSENWMGRHFFTGGMMPSGKWLQRFQTDLRVVKSWEVNGHHYQRTCEAWLQNLDAQRTEIQALFRSALSASDTDRQIQRWRMFFLACAELFGFRGGNEWFVIHLLFEPINNDARSGGAPEVELRDAS